MFTGIVEELGEVAEVRDLPGAARLALRGPKVAVDARPGDSIAVSGVCLTVVSVAGGVFRADVMAETLRCSSLRALRVGDPVNLERPLTPTSRLGGHVVQGHVDGVGTIRSRRREPHWELVRIDLPAGLARYVVEKGSIAVDGVSLTVAALDEDTFTVSLIPTTLGLTTLGSKDVGDPVNLEVDVMAKYVEKLLAGRAASASGRPA